MQTTLLLMFFLGKGDLKWFVYNYTALLGLVLPDYAWAAVLANKKSIYNLTLYMVMIYGLILEK